MTNMKKWVGGALVVGAAVGLVWVLMQAGGDHQLVARSAPGAPGVSATPPMAVPQARDAWLDAAGAAAGAAPEASPLSTMSPPRFSADANGKLVLNGDTHANLEKLLLQEHPDAIRATLDQSSKNLPPQAVAELKVLVTQFEQYSKALSHSISPEHAPQNEQEGLTLIDSLHALRVSYLGPDATQAMFGEEEATTRQIVTLMAADKDPTLSQEQKAERAQEVISKKRQPALPPAS